VQSVQQLLSFSLRIALSIRGLVGFVCAPIKCVGCYRNLCRGHRLGGHNLGVVSFFDHTSAFFVQDFGLLGVLAGSSALPSVRWRRA